MPTNGQAQIKYPWETDGAPTSLPGAASTGTAAAPAGAPAAPAATAAASDGSVPYPWEVPADQTQAQPAAAAAAQQQPPQTKWTDYLNPFSSATSQLPFVQKLTGALARPETQAAMGVAIPAMGPADPMGALLKRGAAPMAEAALEITPKMRSYGRTPGAAVLAETSGITPRTLTGTVEDALNRVGSEINQMADRATQAGATGSNTPAKMTLANIVGGVSRNAPTLAAKLSQLDPLLELGSGTAGRTQWTPNELLEMKRGIDQEIRSWPAEWKEPQGIGPRVQAAKMALYHALDSELDRLIPGFAEKNQVYSSLKPAEEQATHIALGPGLAQRLAGRVAAHTGALMGAGTGVLAGERVGGPLGAIAGGLAGFIGPELLTSAGKMAAARGLQAAGNLPLTPALLRLLQTATAEGGPLGQIPREQQK